MTALLKFPLSYQAATHRNERNRTASISVPNILFFLPSLVSGYSLSPADERHRCAYREAALDASLVLQSLFQPV